MFELDITLVEKKWLQKVDYGFIEKGRIIGQPGDEGFKEIKIKYEIGATNASLS